MSKGSIIALVVAVAALLGGMFVWKGMQRSKAETEARAAPVQMLSMTKTYKENQAYIDGLLREGHDAAFAKAYVSGSLFSPSEWDEQVYVEAVMGFVVERVKADGKADLVKGLPGVHEKPTQDQDKRFGG